MKVVLLISAMISIAAARFIIKDNNGEPALEVIYQAQATEIYKDELTGAYGYLAIYEPDPYENFFLLGMRAEPHWDPLAGTIQMAKAVSPQMESKYMRHPYDFVEIWRDQGGFGTKDVAFWRPQCDPGFHSVGDIAFACSWCGWPKPGSYLTRIMCISDELLDDCTFKSIPLWTNDGGWENDQGSVWEVEGSLSRFWMGNKGHTSLPNIGRAYCLKEPEFQP